MACRPPRHGEPWAWPPGHAPWVRPAPPMSNQQRFWKKQGERLWLEWSSTKSRSGSKRERRRRRLAGEIKECHNRFRESESASIDASTLDSAAAAPAATVVTDDEAEPCHNACPWYLVRSTPAGRIVITDRSPRDQNQHAQPPPRARMKRICNQSLRGVQQRRQQQEQQQEQTVIPSS